MKPTNAGLGARVVAFAWDYLPISAYLVLVVGAGASANAFAPWVTRALFSNPVAGQFAAFCLVTLPISAYFVRGESSAAQATWGKRRKSLKVIRDNGDRLTLSRAIGRTALKLVPWELAHTCIWQLQPGAGEPSPLVAAGLTLVWVLVGANVAGILLSKTRQTIYDRLAGTLVVTIRG